MGFGLFIYFFIYTHEAMTRATTTPCQYHRRRALLMRLLSVIFSFGALRAAAATCEKNRKRHFIPLIDRLGGTQTKVPFWSELSKVTLGSDDVRDAYVRKFRTTIESRFKTKVETVLKTIQLNHRLDLTRDFPGYSIPPHTDTNDKAVTILYYLAKKEGKSKTSMGTRTYVSKKNESDAWKDGIASAANNFKGFTEVESAPFVPNVVFAFAPCWSSWHGVKSIGNSERDTIQGFITIEQLANKKELKEYLRTTRRKKNIFRELWKESCLYRKPRHKFHWNGRLPSANI